MASVSDLGSNEVTAAPVWRQSDGLLGPLGNGRRLRHPLLLLHGGVLLRLHANYNPRYAHRWHLHAFNFALIRWEIKKIKNKKGKHHCLLGVTKHFLTPNDSNSARATFHVVPNLLVQRIFFNFLSSYFLLPDVVLWVWLNDYDLVLKSIFMIEK